MATASNCRLLSIPRELRNKIYGSLTADHTISERLPDIEAAEIRPQVDLENTIAVNVLLVSRQIHDEYREHVTSSSLLVINTAGRAAFPRSLVDLKLKSSFPIDLLKQVSKCEIVTSCALVEDVEGPRMRSFNLVMTALQQLDQRSLSWTSSKGSTIV